MKIGVGGGPMSNLSLRAPKLLETTLSVMFSTSIKETDWTHMNKYKRMCVCVCLNNEALRFCFYEHDG